MPTNSELLQRAKDAIEALYNDMSVPARETDRNMQELARFIREKMEEKG